MAAVTKELAITNQRGLHARASAKFVKCAEGFNADITVSRDGEQTKVVVRSHSRIGKGDLGANAKRIRKFQDDLAKRLATG